MLVARSIAEAHPIFWEYAQAVIEMNWCMMLLNTLLHDQVFALFHAEKRKQIIEFDIREEPRS
jgi:hypothetical protein